MNNWQYYLLTVYANARLFLRVGIILQKYIIKLLFSLLPGLDVQCLKIVSLDTLHPECRLW